MTEEAEEQSPEMSEELENMGEYIQSLEAVDLNKLTPDNLVEMEEKINSLLDPEKLAKLGIPGGVLPPYLQERVDRIEGELYPRINNARRYLAQFEDSKTLGAPLLPIATGFERLDNILDGGLYEGLYIIGAISSLGKTTWAMQIADQVAGTGKDVLVFSLEMARSELIAKSISRNTFKATFKGKRNSNLAKTARELLKGSWPERFTEKEFELVGEAMIEYNNTSAGNLYILEGEGDLGFKEVKEAVEKHVRLTGNKPLVVVDYLQIMAPWDPRATDKQNMDKAILELKRLSRRYGLTIICISSVNRQNYNSPATMEMLKESGSLEYSADVVFGLQLHGVELEGKKIPGTKESFKFDVDEAKRADPRQVELKLLKNRNGITGEKLYFNFFPKFNYFEECDPFEDFGADW